MPCRDRCLLRGRDGQLLGALSPGARLKRIPWGYPVAVWLLVWVAHLSCPWSLPPGESPGHVVQVAYSSRCQ